jgi:hypothetical protein
MRKAVDRTMAAINTNANWDADRINQAKQFINKAKKSDSKRKAEKASRKRNRR